MFGQEKFGGQAAAFLERIETVLLPKLFLEHGKDGITADLPVLLGGYSLAGLFALWAVYQSERFCGVAAVSPSVWFPNWMAYVKTHIPHVKKAYFSLGDREEDKKSYDGCGGREYSNNAGGATAIYAETESHS